MSSDLRCKNARSGLDGRQMAVNRGCTGAGGALPWVYEKDWSVRGKRFGTC